MNNNDRRFTHLYTVIGKQWQQLRVSVLLLSTLLFSSLTLAVDIAQQPIFLENQSIPNVMFILDDSGSMDLEILTVPHHEAWRYDRDLSRSWAKGGDLQTSYNGGSGAEYTKNGSWVSYAGRCQDRNGDGICYNRHDYNTDGDDTDEEQAGFTQTNTTTINGEADSCTSYTSVDYIEHDRPRHRHYTGGSCNCASCGSGGVVDSQDYLPEQLEQFVSTKLPTTLPLTNRKHLSNYHLDVASLLGILTGSAKVEADSLVCSVEALEHEDTDSWHRMDNTYDPLNIIVNSVATTEPDKCTADGGSWSWTTYHWDNNESTVIGVGHDADSHDHLDHSSKNRDQTKTYSKADSYHYPSTSTTTNTTIGALDINGNGSIRANLDGENGFYEHDLEPNKRERYSYLYESVDNVFFNTAGVKGTNTHPERSCVTNKLYRSVYSCDYLQHEDYSQTNYYFDADNSNQVATFAKWQGNEAILTLPAEVDRQVRDSGTFPWPSRSLVPAEPSTKVSFQEIVWSDWQGAGAKPANYPATVSGHTSPAGTHHAMSKWDPWPLIVDWRLRSADLNVLYYSPQNDYSNWPGLADDASFRAVRSNPEPTSTGYSDMVDLARPHSAETVTNSTYVPYEHPTEAGFVYEVWRDDAGYWWTLPEYLVRNNCDDGAWDSDYYEARKKHGRIVGMVDPGTGRKIVNNDQLCSTYTDVANGEVDLWDTHDRVTVYTDKIVVQTVRRTPHVLGEQIDASKPDERAFVSDTRISNTVEYLPANYATYSTDSFCLEVLGEDPDNLGHCKTVAQVKKNAANWYQFSRRRAFVAKGAIANLLSDSTLPDLRYGLSVTSQVDGVPSLFKAIPAGTAPYTVHNEEIRESLYQYAWAQRGTPLRKSLHWIGEYFKGNQVDPNDTKPIIESCQKNFALMLTDGYWNGDPPSGVGNADEDPYWGSKATGQPTLADVAKKYYDDDLDPHMANEVPDDTFDTNTQQHLTTIGIGFGVEGTLTDDNGNGWPGSVADGGSSKTESDDWGNPVSNDQHKINDLWHAAYNSRGLYLNAKNPAELISKLNNAILFASSATASASGLRANSNFLNADTRLYQTIFTSQEWDGDVLSHLVDASGALSQVWSAQALLDAPAVTAASRKIFTLDSSGVPTVFKWADLDASQQVDLRKAWPNAAVVPITAASNTFGEAQVNFIRGDHDPLNDSQFRDRVHKLGDIVHSAAVYVGKPNLPYRNNWGSGRRESASGNEYSAFRLSHSGRSSMLYVGANDGMMHAFDATTGIERYAYIPSMLTPRLNSLTFKKTTTRDFEHRYYVDASPTVGDAFFDKGSADEWHSVLVGGLGAGGKGIYALDVTTTGASDSEGTIAGNVGAAGAKGLWEFTDSTAPADMGYTFSEPSIVRTHDNDGWAAVFGNGYNSANGKAILYIVDIEDGSLIDKIVADIGPDNGLSTPTVIDTDGDFIADLVYAGDLKGNLWRFDIGDSGSWGVSFGGEPLFKATDGIDAQPITTKVVVTQHALGAAAGFMVSFGTGKYLGLSDDTDIGQVTQSLYSIWDYNQEVDTSSGHGNIARNDLFPQEILAEPVHASGQENRITSNNGAISWMAAGHHVGDSGWRNYISKKGWYLDLINTHATPPNNVNRGERIITKVIIRAGVINVNTMLPAEDACQGGGTSFPMKLDAETGNRLDGLVDANGDGVIDVNDVLTWSDGTNTFTTSSSGTRSGNMQNDSLILNNGDGTGIEWNDNIPADPEDRPVPDLGGSGRQSWIQLD